MAIKSTFYDTSPGEGVKETSWAQSALSRGPLYGVVDDALRLTPHPATPYAVNLSAGAFFGHGVWDETDTVERVQCVAPAVGVTRWDLIAARRDWQPTGGGPTSLVAIRGGSTAAIPTSREKRPGVLDDQPAWLVQWKGGETQPVKTIDLRCWPGPGGLEIADKLALGYLATPGTAAKLGSSMWRYERKSNGTWGWEEYKTPKPREAGYKVVWTNVDGYCTVPFDEPFPDGCVGATGTCMNPPVDGAVFQFISASNHGANFRVFAPRGGPLVSQRVGVFYDAVGR